MYLLEISTFSLNCHCQTYQNYEQSQQKLGTFLVDKEPYKSKFSKNIINLSWSPNQIFFKEFFLERFDQFQTLKNDFDKVVHNFGKSDKVIIW